MLAFPFVKQSASCDYYSIEQTLFSLRMSRIIQMAIFSRFWVTVFVEKIESTNELLST